MPLRHPSLSTTRLGVRFLEALFCAVALGAASWILAASPTPVVSAAAFTAAIAAIGLIIAGAHILVPAIVHVTHHGRRLLKHHPVADAASSSALSLAFIVATALLFAASGNRGCVMSAARPRGAGAGLSSDGTASKAAQQSFALDSDVHIWPNLTDSRSAAHVGWTMLIESLFAGQLSRGRDPAYQQLLAAHVRRIWAPYTTADRGMAVGSGNSSASADDAALAAIYDAGQVSFNPRGAVTATGNGTASLASFEPIGRWKGATEGTEIGMAAPTGEIDAYVTLRPEPNGAPVGPQFVGYDMVETTLRAYEGGESPEFLHAVAPYIKKMWAPYTKPLDKPYEELNDYDKVMVDTFNAGEVSLDAFRPLEGAEERRAALAAAAAVAAQLHSTVCSLQEAIIAASLLCVVAFGSSTALAFIDLKRMQREASKVKLPIAPDTLAEAKSLRGGAAGGLGPALSAQPF